MKHFVLSILSLSALVLFSACQTSRQSIEQADRTTPPSSESADAPEAAQTYLFAWGATPAELADPRGGTTMGASVAFAKPTPLPLAAIATATSPKEKDRAAILSLAGNYKTSFHFLETLGLYPEHQPARPYHSWSTEQVRVLADRDDFISLQHTLVIYFQQPDGTVSEPMIMKHWRQDWTYQDTELHAYRGDGTWERQTRSPESVQGAWSQAVWQVDDSPRYEVIGRWSHQGNRSVWTSESAWRPLPRREYSVRNDYGVMEGIHRIILTPTGWVHEQDNWKRVAGASAPRPEFRAREIGVDRYQRITAPDLSPADEYWEKTGPYWAAVRRAWQDVFAAQSRFALESKVDGRSQFEHHFEYAAQLESGEPWNPQAGSAHARQTIESYLSDQATDTRY